METKKDFTIEDVPYGFAMCSRDDCEVCDHCLRHMAIKKITEKNRVISHVNPYLVKPTAECEFFRSDELATYARGFARMKDEMLPRQYEEFKCRLIGSKCSFGRTGYYERRRGERLCSPAEIKKIRSVLQELKLPDLEFDGYQKQYNFCD